MHSRLIKTFQVEYKDVDDNFSDRDGSEEDIEKLEKKEEKKERKPQVPIFPMATTQANPEGDDEGADSDNDDPTGKIHVFFSKSSTHCRDAESLSILRITFRIGGCCFSKSITL